MDHHISVSPEELKVVREILESGAQVEPGLLLRVVETLRRYQEVGTGEDPGPLFGSSDIDEICKI